MRYARAGGQLVITSMDRCARSLTDLYSIVDDLVERGVSVKFSQRGTDLLEEFHASGEAHAGATEIRRRI